MRPLWRARHARSAGVRWHGAWNYRSDRSDGRAGVWECRSRTLVLPQCSHVDEHDAHLALRHARAKAVLSSTIVEWRMGLGECRLRTGFGFRRIFDANPRRAARRLLCPERA